MEENMGWTAGSKESTEFWMPHPGPLGPKIKIWVPGGRIWPAQCFYKKLNFSTSRQLRCCVVCHNLYYSPLFGIWLTSFICANVLGPWRQLKQLRASSVNMRTSPRDIELYSWELKGVQLLFSYNPTFPSGDLKSKRSDMNPVPDPQVAQS